MNKNQKDTERRNPAIARKYQTSTSVCLPNVHQLVLAWMALEPL